MVNKTKTPLRLYRNARDKRECLFPIVCEGEFYYVRFNRRGVDRLDCTGVYKFELTGEKLTPAFSEQNKNEQRVVRVMREAREKFKIDILRLNK